MADVVTVEVWNPSYQHSEIDLSALPEVYRSIPESASIGLTLADTEDDCVIVTVEPEFSTVTRLRDRTFYNLQISDDSSRRRRGDDLAKGVSPAPADGRPGPLGG
ncbi:hypothetical protein ACFY1B_10840 [Streptomyces mirabilis]|uniref:hypothetical protein n=1 Tax=Streptomyces mirabilis TaxID=68239 RepID=UPI0036A0482D